MKAQELRIGNYVNLNGKDKQLGIGGLKEIAYEEFSPKHTNVFKPIPLTEEWLVKFGFERVALNDGVHYENDNMWIYLLSDCFDLELNTHNERFNLFRQYKKHVHQLQNLFFALTGEELTT